MKKSLGKITLKNYLENDGKDNFDNYKYLNQIKDSAPSIQNAYQYAKLLYELHIKRSLIGIGQGLVQNTITNEQNLQGNTLIENAEKYKATKGKIYNEKGEYSKEYLNYY